jgi:hypothetical protein
MHHSVSGSALSMSAILDGLASLGWAHISIVQCHSRRRLCRRIDLDGMQPMAGMAWMGACCVLSPRL